MKSLLTQMLIFAVNTNLRFAHFHTKIKKSQTYLLRLSQIQMPRGSALANLTTDWKIVMQQRAYFPLAFQIVSLQSCMTS